MGYGVKPTPLPPSKPDNYYPGKKREMREFSFTLTYQREVGPIAKSWVERQVANWIYRKGWSDCILSVPDIVTWEAIAAPEILADGKKAIYVKLKLPADYFLDGTE